MQLSNLKDMIKDNFHQLGRQFNESNDVLKEAFTSDVKEKILAYGDSIYHFENNPFAEGALHDSVVLLRI